MKKTIAVTLIAFALSGCAVQKEMVPVGGSKADGTVRMGYTHGAFEVPKVNMLKAQDLAAKRCQIWGYTSAEPFGGQTTTCSQTDGFGGCNITNVFVDYQCTGGKASQN
ncbi:hypothetical protein I9Y19_005284 [Citrobacter freundii]|nr:hypothetical protein [Citrobacter freundii]EKX9690830.1 hypothetical protein [Citrobacter freundii]HBI7073319.1 hypothetical protein [Citrobacter freundii]HCJ7736270.1 hypothetical protein [Citrobacter freundii]HEB9648317.1 hypothetical protein [Citrobacter freundii]